MKVVHVEAGLRSGNKCSPFPEEANRTLIGHLADVHFVPTHEALQNLKRENILNHVYQVGNTVIDALFLGLELNQKKSESSFIKKFKNVDFTKKIILVTGHRRESFGEPFQNMCLAIQEIAVQFVEEVQIIYPVHLNPNVRKAVQSFLAGFPNIFLIEPLDYSHLIWLMEKAYLVLTDSGGIQEEAPSLGKPVLVMRDVTERQEGIEAGTAKLVGTDRNRIVNNVTELLLNEEAYNQMAHAVNPYGDGTASKQIKNIITDFMQA